MQRPVQSTQSAPKKSLARLALLLSACLLISSNTAFAEEAKTTKLPNGQELLPLKIEVLDENGKPVADAKVTPDALRSSYGHGRWVDDDEQAGIGPATVLTDSSGMATILYPRLRNVKMKRETTSVSIRIDHPSFAIIDRTNVKLPMKNAKHTVSLVRGGTLEVQPLMDDKPASLDGLHALWSDARSWQPGANPERTTEGTLRFPALAPGPNTVLISKLDGALTTHFSRIVHYEIKVGETLKLEIPLQSARRIEGILSPNVPRPVRNGRVVVGTYRADNGGLDHVEWGTWVPIRANGTFTIPGWPIDERIQVIAMCDGFVAESGEPPEPPKVAPDVPDAFLRAQVFEPGAASIQVAMTPMSLCEITTVDADRKPIKGVQVNSYPNVQWWGNGSQVYCGTLIRGEQLLLTRDYNKAADDSFPYPFEGVTDVNGKVTLEIPTGLHRFWVEHQDYALPLIQGNQMSEKIEIVTGKTARVNLQMRQVETEQPVKPVQ